MNDSITIQKALRLLQEDGLLVEYSGPQDLLQKPFTHLSYAPADVQPDTFFICKGLNFKEQYLLDAAAKGAGVYLSAKKYAAEIPCILVSDIQQGDEPCRHRLLWRSLQKLPADRPDRN